MTASETVYGLHLKEENYKNKYVHSYFGGEKQQQKNRQKCATCGLDDPL